MDKFTKILKNDKTEEVLNDVELDDIYKDQIAILPYFKDEGYVIFIYETSPQIKNNNNNYYLSCVKDQYDDKISNSQNIRNVLHKKLGIILNGVYQLEIHNVLYKDVLNQGQFYISLLELNYNDYKQTYVKNSENKIVKVSIGDLNSIRLYDLITDYLVLKLKYDYNIK